MDTAALLSYGIDYNRGLKNCMGKPDFYKKILNMFMEDPCFDRAKGACAAGNQKELFALMHELKGTSGNAALIKLYTTSTPLVELLRHGNADTAKVNEMFAEVEKAYALASEGIAIITAD